MSNPIGCGLVAYLVISLASLWYFNRSSVKAAFGR